jgi:hypothetical protein
MLPATRSIIKRKKYEQTEFYGSRYAAREK